MNTGRNSFKLYLYAVLIIAVFTLTFVPNIHAVVGGDYSYGAHRGSSMKYIENSFEAIKEAAESNEYEFIEFDVQYTKDRKIIVYHDNGLWRLEGLSGNVYDYTYEELVAMELKHIPLYEDIMDLIGTEKGVNIEIKSQGKYGDDMDLVDEIVADIYERGIEANVLFSAISEDVVKYISTEYPEFDVGKIYWLTRCTYVPFDFCTESLYEELEEMGATHAMLHGLNLRNYDSLIRLKPEGMTLSFWYFTDAMFILSGV